MNINWKISNAPRQAWFLFQRALQRRLERGKNRGRREKAVLVFVKTHAEPGNPAAVLDAMDNFAMQESWMMNIGPKKGEVLTGALTESDARKVLEIGAYCGYSATLIGQFLKSRRGRLISIEKNERFAGVAREVVAHAGLADIVEIRTGVLETELGRLPGPFDAVLLDHWKDEYLPDLKRLEAAGMLRKGSAVVADNVGFFAVPEYLKHVRECGRYRSRYFEASIEYIDSVKDGVEVSIFTG